MYAGIGATMQTRARMHRVFENSAQVVEQIAQWALGRLIVLIDIGNRKLAGVTLAGSFVESGGEVAS